MTQYAEAETALAKTKIALMAKPDTAFFTTLAFSLRHVIDPSVQTACVNGKTMVVSYNPDFLLKHTPEERVGLMVHETMHMAYGHVDGLRIGSRDPDKWNIAGDYVINLQITDRGFKIPPGGLLDPQYRDLSTEQVYDRLPANPPPPPMQDIQIGNGGNGAQSPDPQIGQNIQDILVRASIASKMAGDSPGTIPGDIQIYLDSLLDPKLPWHAILRKWFQSYAKNDYSMQRPNRRFFPEHHLPSLYSRSLIDLAMAVDASASVSDEEFQQQVSETGSILRMMKPSKITLLQFDTRIKSVDTVRSVEELRRLTFTGRGGTQIAPVIEWINANKPQVMLIFTDGHFRWPAIKPSKTEIVWLIYNNPHFTAPYGKVVHFEV